MNIIKNGKILESKLYSTNEATLVVSNSRKIYVCSISNDLTKCILSNKKYKIN
jgi:alpha-amylase/alpha-mannosidase (GH57 family)